MSWNAGALGAMMGFGQGLEQVGGMLMQGIQKKQQAADENEVWMKRQAMIQSLKPPETRQVKVDDPDHPGRSLLQTQAYQPPDLNDPSSKGAWNVVSTEHVQPKYVKDTQTLPGNKEQAILYNENDPTDVHPLGVARDIWNPADADYKRAELGLSAGRLAEETRYHNQEHDDKVAGVGTRQSTVPHDFDLPDGVKVQGNLVPGRGIVPLQTPAGDFLVKGPKLSQADRDAGVVPPPTDFDSINAHFSPPSDFPGSFQFTPEEQKAAQALKRTPMSQLSGSAIDAGGSGAQQTPRPAQASSAATGPGGAGPTPQASAQGKGQPKLQINRSTGQKRYVYPDGTIVPVGQ